MSISSKNEQKFEILLAFLSIRANIWVINRSLLGLEVRRREREGGGGNIDNVLRQILYRTKF